MRIANPIYDAVFKFFMEDPEVAKRLISNIIGQEVVSLVAQPQEVVTQSKVYPISVLRLDYKAVIINEQGEQQKVLIEMQKADNRIDIQRFRRYLGENYAKPDIIGEEEVSLPIICIYFLGFRVQYILTKYPVLKATSQIIDVSTSLPIEEQYEAFQDDFIKLLTHTSYFIQIPNLPESTQNLLLHRLSAFNQTNMTHDVRWQLEFEDWKTIKDPDLQLFVKRLWFAMQNTIVQEEVLAEQEIDTHFDRLTHKIEKLDQAIIEKDQVLAEKDQVLAEKDQVLAEKDQVLAEKDQVLAEKDQVLAEKDQVLAEKDQALAQAEQHKITTAKNFIALGLSVDAVAAAMQVSAGEVQNWLKK
jgi:hypothetical protein